MTASAAHCATALSEHPLATHAVGECIGRLLELGGPAPDLVVLGATGPYVGALEDVVAAVRQLLTPGVLIGSSAAGVLAGGREVEEHGALMLFGLWCADRRDPSPSDGAAAVRPVRLALAPGPLGPDPAELEPLRGAEGTLLVLADPHTAPVEQLVERLAELAPDLLVVGGSAGAARHRGGDRLLLDDGVHTTGAVAALLPPTLPVTALVSQGCRPIGPPLTVTASERHVVVELAGRPALEVLLEIVDELSSEDRALAARELYLGRVVDEHRQAPGAGDFLVRHVLGADRERGAVAVGDEIPLGATVQFQLRDAAAATADLEAILQRGAAEPGPAGALLLTCEGRGSRLFGVPDHDASSVAEHLDGAAVGGLVCAAGIGPIGGRSFLHALSATVVLLG